MASADRLRINVHGRQTHASQPWRGVDPVVTSAQIILALQTIVSRQIDSTVTPAVVSISTIHGGVRNNILPDDVAMEGTLRAHDEGGARRHLEARIDKTATTIADAARRQGHGHGLRGRAGDLQRSAAHRLGHAQPEDGLDTQRVTEVRPVMGAEDFSYLAQVVPGMFFFLGVTPPEEDPLQAPANHSPLFHVHEPALKYGVRALSLSRDRLSAAAVRRRRRSALIVGSGRPRPPAGRHRSGRPARQYRRSSSPATAASRRR